MIRRPRNALGWIIPSEGTASRALYECMMADIPRNEIWDLLRRQWGLNNRRTFSVMVHNVRRPDDYNVRQRVFRYQASRQLKFKFTFPEGPDA